MQTLRELGISTSFMTQCRRSLHCECEDLVFIGMDMFGREQQLGELQEPYYERLKHDCRGSKYWKPRAMRRFLCRWSR